MAQIKPEENSSNLLDLFNPLSEGKESITMSLKLLASALTLVAGLAWNDAIKAFIEKVVQPALNDLFNQTLGDLAVIITPFIYAILITGLVVFFVNRIKRVEEKTGEEARAPRQKVSE